MKIAQIMPEFGLAGAEIMCENLVYELKKLGHQVIVISLYDYHSAITERLEKNHVSIIYLNKKPGFDISIFLKLYKVFKKEKFDAIHMHRYITFYAVPPAVLVRIPVKIHTIHSVATYDNHGLGRFLNKVFYHCFRTIPVSLSELVKETVASTYHLNNKCIPVIYNGIDLKKLRLKKNYELNNTIILLHIGRFIEAKNHRGLIDAFEIISKEIESIKLRLIGDGELRSEIQSYVEKKKLSEKVEFLGLIDDCADYLSKADVYILASYVEGMPITLIEAMGSGLPIVSTNVGGISNMITKDNAILVNPDTHEISDAVLELLKNEEKRKKLGSAAKIRSQRFSSEVMAKEYERLYVHGYSLKDIQETINE